MEFEPGLRESCGLFGCLLAEGVSPNSFKVGLCVANALSALQHRGNESSGIVGTDGNPENITIHKGKGLVREVFTEESVKKFDDCVAAIGHNRYSTAGMKDAINCIQPFVIHTVAGILAVAHNGELVNAQEKRQEVLRGGVGLSTDTDSELIAQIIARTLAEQADNHDYAKDGIAVQLLSMLNELVLSYSLVLIIGKRMYAVRDPWGNRPLSIGVIKAPNAKINGTTHHDLGWVVSSETCAFQPPATFLREVQPGEIVEITQYGVSAKGKISTLAKKKLAFCIFEYVYFARPDSMMEGRQVNSVREHCGRLLAKEAPVDVDIVSNVPDGATPAALAYSKQLNIPYVQVFYKNAYVGRSFIQPSTQLRQAAILRKFGILTENFAGKSVVLVDDSIVRGNTMGPIVKLLKDNGALKVHVRIASPPLLHPCYMGVNIPDHSELIAHRLLKADGSKQPDLKALAAHIGADSVNYLSVDGLIRAVRGIEDDTVDVRNTRHCTACLTGEYPVPPKHLQW